MACGAHVGLVAVSCDMLPSVLHGILGSISIHIVTCNVVAYVTGVYDKERVLRALLYETMLLK